MFVTYPLDVVRSRVAFELEVGMVDTVRAMLYLEGGLRSFYRGIIPSMLGMAPYSGKNGFKLSLSIVRNWYMSLVKPDSIHDTFKALKPKLNLTKYQLEFYNNTNQNPNNIPSSCKVLEHTHSSC